VSPALITLAAHAAPIVVYVLPGPTCICAFKKMQQKEAK